MKFSNENNVSSCQTLYQPIMRHISGMSGKPQPLSSCSSQTLSLPFDLPVFITWQCDKCATIFTHTYINSLACIENSCFFFLYETLMLSYIACANVHSLAFTFHLTPYCMSVSVCLCTLLKCTKSYAMEFQHDFLRYIHTHSSAIYFALIANMSEQEMHSYAL